MIVGTAEVEVVANGSGFEKELKAQTDPALQGISSDADKAGQDLSSSLGEGVEKGHSGLNKVLSGLGVPDALLGGWGELGIAAVGVAAGTIAMAIGMQKADTQIATSEGISVKAATSIGNAFLDTAGKVEFSGKEQAEAFAAVAGQMRSTEGHALSLSQTTTFMNATMDLATAKQIDLKTATATTASVMQAFQSPIKDTAAVTNILFNASNATGQSIDAIGNSLDKIKAKMGSTAPSMKDMAGLLVDLTNHGETGRAAVTALGSAFTNLVAPAVGATAAQQQANYMQHLAGVSFTDSAGKMLSMGKIIAQVSPLIKGQSAAQATATLTSLGFGSASSKLVGIMQAGPDAYDKTAAAVARAGSAHAAAAIQSHTMGVEIKTIEAAGEDWATMIGEKLIPILQKVVAAILPVTKAFIGLISYVMDHKPLLVIVGTAVAALGGYFTVMGIMAAAAWVAALSPVVLVIAAIALVAAAVYEVISHWGVIEGFFKRLWKDIEPIFKIAAQVMLVAITGPIGLAIVLWMHFHDQIVAIFKQLPGDIVAALGDIVGTIFGGLADAWNWIKTNVYDPIVTGFEQLPSDIGNAMGAALGALGDIGKDVINDLIDGINDGINLVNDHIPSVFGVKIFPSIPDIPKLASGGYVPATPGGMLALLGEGGQGEYVIPEDRLGSPGGAGNGSSKTTIVNGGVHAHAHTNVDTFEMAHVLGQQLRML